MIDPTAGPYCPPARLRTYHTASGASAIQSKCVCGLGVNSTTGRSNKKEFGSRSSKAVTLVLGVFLRVGVWPVADWPVADWPVPTRGAVGIDVAACAKGMESSAALSEGISTLPLQCGHNPRLPAKFDLTLSHFPHCGQVNLMPIRSTRGFVSHRTLLFFMLGHPSSSRLPSALSPFNFGRSGKGVRSPLPERPFGCFAQLTPDPFTRPQVLVVTKH